MAARPAPRLRLQPFRETRWWKSIVSQHCPKNNEERRMKLSSSRRGFFGIVASLAASLALPRRMCGAKAAESSPKLAGFGQSGNPYDELGVPTVINAEGTMTVLGGSLGRPEVEAVMAQATRHFVSIPALEVAAGKRIAQ